MTTIKPTAATANDTASAASAATATGSADSSETQPKGAGFVSALDSVAARIESLNGKLVDAAKQTGNVSLDTYEKALSGTLEFQEKVSAVSSPSWVGDLVKAQASFVTDISGAFTSAARNALK